MHTLSRSFLLTLAIAHATIGPAYASDFERLCQGLGALVCGPGKIINAASEALQPPAPSQKLDSAIKNGDIAEVKHLLDAGGSLVSPDFALASAVDTYFFAKDKNIETRQLELIKYLMNERVDMKGFNGRKLLSSIVNGYSYINNRRPMIHGLGGLPWPTSPLRMAPARTMFR